jgi:hypothetical protein
MSVTIHPSTEAPANLVAWLNACHDDPDRAAQLSGKFLESLDEGEMLMVLNAALCKTNSDRDEVLAVFGTWLERNW